MSDAYHPPAREVGLMLLSAVALIVAFLTLHADAPEEKGLSGTGLVMVALTSHITTCVHRVVLTVGRQADATAMPGHGMLLAERLDDSHEPGRGGARPH